MPKKKLEENSAKDTGMKLLKLIGGTAMLKEILGMIGFRTGFRWGMTVGVLIGFLIAILAIIAFTALK